jgi:hypothetical protein
VKFISGSTSAGPREIAFFRWPEGVGEGGEGEGRGRGIKFQTPYQKMRKYPRTQIAEPDEIIYIVERKL